MTILKKVYNNGNTSLKINLDKMIIKQIVNLKFSNKSLQSKKNNNQNNRKIMKQRKLTNCFNKFQMVRFIWISKMIINKNKMLKILLKL